MSSACARARSWICWAADCLSARSRIGPFDAGLLTQIEELREELNWFYSQINRPREGEFIQDAAVIEQLHQEVRTRETALQEITRQLQQRGKGTMVQLQPLDLALLQRDLGPDTVLVEYFALDDELLAFVVTEAAIEVVRRLTQRGTARSSAGAISPASRHATLRC